MTVGVTVESGVATISINRPDQLNALDQPTRESLLKAIVSADEASDIEVVVLTGAGRAFCVGQDLAASDELIDADVTVRDTYNPIVEAITRSAKPFVAAVNGPAVGAGMGLALACDVVVMSEASFYSCAFSRVGLVPDTGTSLALARIVGHLRAFEIAATARRLTPAEALTLGLTTDVASTDDFDVAVRERVTELRAGSSHALGLTKRILRSVDSAELTESLELEANHQGIAARHEDHAEGVSAFGKGRTPGFRNRTLLEG